MKINDALQKLYDLDYEQRHAQEEMMHCISDAIENKDVAIIEGGTGIGKSYGYLIPALLNRPAKKQIVIATATVSLQEQLFNKDLRSLRQQLDLNFSYSIAKGRQRYICLHKLYQTDDANQDDLFVDSDVAELNAAINSQQPAASDLVLFQKLKHALEQGQWDGDRDNYPTTLPNNAWQRVTTDSHRCMKKSCEFFHHCPYYKARKKQFNADVLVTNHNFLLADLAMGSGTLLPALENSILIIDEAHNFPEKAIEALSSNITLLGATDWLTLSEKINKKVLTLSKELSAQAQYLLPLSIELIKYLKLFHATVHDHFLQMPDEKSWQPDIIPESLLNYAQHISTLATQLVPRVEKLLESMKKLMMPGVSTIPSSLIAATGFFFHRVENLQQTFSQLISQHDDISKPPIAKWFTQTGKHQRAGIMDYQCHTAPISAAANLVKVLWQERENAVIMCSATLCSLGSFDYFIEKTGLNLLQEPPATTLALASPFDYAASQLIIPAMRNEPSFNSNQHLKELITLLPKLFHNAHGTLVLFTSKYSMLEAYHAISEQHAINHILLQGQMPRQKIMQQHFETIEKQRPSIIFGMQSFAEGIDLPGNLCKTLIITKLPFAIPSSPIELTRQTWLKTINKNPFRHYALPETSVRLTQFAGRLIRSSTDQGTLYILDRRIQSKSYGRLLLRGLPPFSINIEENLTNEII